MKRYRLTMGMSGMRCEEHPDGEIVWLKDVQPILASHEELSKALEAVASSANISCSQSLRRMAKSALTAAAKLEKGEGNVQHD